ncbi:hypothetical protein BDQ17DRAFT_1191483, partial [Cyathus striatus]
KLPITSHPEEVTSWVRRSSSKKHKPLEITATDYGHRFYMWWTTLQPSWHVLPDGQFSKAINSDKTWTVFQKGGSSGFYMVIMGLYWWVRA